MALQLVRHFMLSFTQQRHFVRTSLFYGSTPSTTDSKPSESGNTSANPKIGIRKVTGLSSFHRFALVFSGKYKSAADIPQYVPIEVLEKARSKARIKVSNYLMLATVLGCLAFAYSGRTAAERGVSVSQMNLDWHQEYNARAEKELKEKKN